MKERTFHFVGIYVFFIRALRTAGASLVFALCVPFISFSQLMLKAELGRYNGWKNYNLIDKFYSFNSYQTFWITKPSYLSELMPILSRADSLGLNKADYQPGFFKSYHPGQALLTGKDSIEADVRITDAAIHFFADLQSGNRVPSFRYMGLKYNPYLNNDIPQKLFLSVKSNLLESMFLDVQPKTREYVSALAKLNWFRNILNEKDFTEIKVTSKIADQNNKALLLRLYQLGVTDTIITKADKKTIQMKVRQAQGLLDLLNDGVLRSTTLAALNVPLIKRITELKTMLNLVRWVAAIKQSSSVLLLNIPSAYLMVYENDRLIIDSKVIVGKPATPTPTLTSTITEVILYPFWNVPYKIATKELLPSIKRDVGFLDRNNYQVLNSEGKVLNPYNINWGGLSRSYFPYHIRQSTGCDNALGVVKFEFYNPFTVYLHDTPSKGLFSFSKRYFSHGCMRVEKPVELAHYLLGKNRVAIDTLTAKGCLYQQAPKPVTAERQLPVMILYSTAWYDREGEVRFYEDIYGKLN